MDWPSEVLPTPGAPTRQRIGPFSFFYPSLHREIFHDAFLHLLESVMIGLEYLLRLAEIAPDTSTLLPRHVQQPIDVIADHGRFGRHRGHHLELVELGGRLAARLFRHPGRLDPLGNVLNLVRRFVHVAEFLLNRLHLLVEVVLALALLHLPFHAAANTLLDLQEIDLLLDSCNEMLQPLSRVVYLENRLLLLDLHREMGSNGIGETCRVFDARKRGQYFRRGLLVELDVLFEVSQKRTGQRLDFTPLFGS